MENKENKVEMQNCMNEKAKEVSFSLFLGETSGGKVYIL